MKTAIASSRCCSLTLAIAIGLARGGVAFALPANPVPEEIFADGFDPPPVADFNYAASGLEVTFTDVSVDVGGTIGTWTWDFGDGATSTLQDPVHAFSAAGTYTVTETVVDSTNGESAVASKSVKVLPCGTLTSYVHDFKAYNEVGGHPDFESSISGVVTGIVNSTITPGGVPTLNPNFTSGMGGVASAESFAQWFTDDPINDPIQQTLTLTENPPGTYSYSNNAYFPIDGEGFGNYQPYMDGQHNFHFTTMLHARFQYSIGQTFSFTGDDDVWVYVDGKLVVDLGGVHGALAASVTLDAVHAILLGLTAGQTYTLDFFQAQRHTTDSNFSLQTTMQCLSDGH